MLRKVWTWLTPRALDQLVNMSVKACTIFGSVGVTLQALLSKKLPP